MSRRKIAYTVLDFTIAYGVKLFLDAVVDTSSMTRTQRGSVFVAKTAASSLTSEQLSTHTKMRVEEVFANFKKKDA